MKPTRSLPRQRRHFDSKRSGLALLIVLSSLVFLSALAVAFLVGVGNELNASKSYAHGSNVRQLADTSVNLVIAQIKTATAGRDSAGGDLAWASQPGMIRTYNARGTLDHAYKLYSSTNMVSASVNLQIETNLISNWYGKPAHFTDLNAPVTPDPKNASFKLYPIMDPAADGQVDGFSIGTRPAGVTTANMPVTWLYVLKNGQIVPPTLPNGATTSAVINGASKQNPIVGRIAFWTDDETCKVNINTAAEGTYWDTPRVYSTEDVALALKQPANKEYQRYPGHPAMTCLSTVFPGLAKETLYTMIPRVTGGTGTSLGGTVDYKTIANGPGVILDKDRLYANTDEFLFNPSRAVQPLSLTELEQKRFFITASSRAPDVNLFNQPRVSIWPITLDRSTGATMMTALDKTFAFCTTINDQPYYFQRKNSNSPSEDLPDPASTTVLKRNRVLLEYLRTLTTKDVPGFGGNLAAKYSAANSSGGTDNDQILTEIFDYIRCTNLLDGSTGATPYAKAVFGTYAGQGQVVPIVDSKTDTRGMGRFPTVGGAALLFIGTADKTTNPNDTNVNGLIPKVGTATSTNPIRMQAALLIDLFDPSLGVPRNHPAYEIRVSGMDQFQWARATSSSFNMGFPSSATISTPVATPSSGYDVMYGGTTGFRRLVIPADTSKVYTLVSQETGWSGQMPDPEKGEIFSFTGRDVKIEIFPLNSSGTAASSPVQTVTINFPSSTNFRAPSRLAGDVIYGGTSPATHYDFNTFFAPGTATYSSSFSSSVLAGVLTTNATPLAGRFLANSILTMITRFDTVRSIVSLSGDHRLVAARSQVTSSNSADFFVKHPKYDTGTEPFAHILRNGMGSPYPGASAGRLVTVNYPGLPSPVTSTHSVNAVNSAFDSTSGYARDISVPVTSNVTPANGDWDNGFGNFTDGAYINKPDEGDKGVSSSTHKPYYGIEWTQQTLSQTLFSPNRMIPSAGMFGSLPTGVWTDQPKPWQTLLFRPGPSTHPGLGSPTSGPPFNTPPDYLYLDLFTMPVVEPYPISEPLSTAGRINMNYQVMPFTYLNRATGLHAILKAEKILAIPDTNASLYKTIQDADRSLTANIVSSFRYDINIPLTLTQFDTRFASGDLFRSPAEICSIELVPKGAAGAPTSGTVTAALMDSFWNNHKLTGDNSRERPYANIYPRLTTKSNTYTVYYKVQTLQKRTTDPGQNTWTEGQDTVTGEYRGSTLIERYVDPNDDAIPDYASASANTTPIDHFYKFRILNSKKFNP